VSDVPLGPGWWQASDLKWYPPEQHPNFQAAISDSSTPLSVGPPLHQPGDPEEGQAPDSEVMVVVAPAFFNTTDPKHPLDFAGRLCVTNWRVILEHDTSDKKRLGHFAQIDELWYDAHHPRLEILRTEVQTDYDYFRQTHPEEPFVVGLGFPGLGIKVGSGGISRLKRSDLVTFDGGRYSNYFKHGIPVLTGIRKGRARERKGVTLQEIWLAERHEPITLVDPSGHTITDARPGIGDAVTRHVSVGLTRGAVRATRGRASERWQIHFSALTESGDITTVLSYLTQRIADSGNAELQS
jgi:hypothetical protein